MLSNSNSLFKSNYTILSDVQLNKGALLEHVKNLIAGHGKKQKEPIKKRQCRHAQWLPANLHFRVTEFVKRTTRVSFFGVAWRNEANETKRNESRDFGYAWIIPSFRKN